MTILENLPIRPDVLGKLMTENLTLHQQLKDSARTLKGAKS
ncbi:hypothetical protein [Paracoccus sediminilitoris]|nr:hypothetical protein [Paracoccus sediminilitoris]